MSSFLDYLESLTNLGIEPSLDAIEALAGRMGDPQRRYKTVQITGTNGKTSTARILAAILSNHNVRCGLYLSPHLIRFNERFIIDSREISDDELAAAGKSLMPFIEAVNKALHPRRLTQFEVVTGLALKWFADMGVEAAVFEVGMGGRWDATSIIQPAVAAVTTVTLDHADYLGDTIEKIAAEKSYVIKSGTAAVAGPVSASVAEILKKRAEDQGGKIFFWGKDFSLERGVNSKLDVLGRFAVYRDLSIKLKGGFQRQNAALAIAAAECFLGRELDHELLSKALLEVESPGRLEVMETSPAIVLDGAHNLGGADELRTSIANEFQYRRLILILSMLKDKDVAAVVDRLAPLADTVIATTNHNPRALDSDELADVARRVNKATVAEPTMAAALARARLLAGGDDLILVTGSLYGVGDCRRLW